MLNGSHKKKLLKLLEDLVNIRSDKKNPAMTAFLKKALRENGWKNIKESGGNVWGKLGSGKIKLLYDIHSDTITARNTLWNTDPFKAEFKNGYLYGRGAVDDKGPLAAAIFSGTFLTLLKNTSFVCSLPTERKLTKATAAGLFSVKKKRSRILSLYPNLPICALFSGREAGLKSLSPRGEFPRTALCRKKGRTPFFL